CERSRVGAKSEPGAMTERYEARVADEDVERHARDADDDDVGGAGQRKPAGEQRERKHNERQRSNDDGRSQLHHSSASLYLLCLAQGRVSASSLNRAPPRPSGLARLRLAGALIRTAVFARRTTRAAETAARGPSTGTSML